MLWCLIYVGMVERCLAQRFSIRAAILGSRWRVECGLRDDGCGGGGSDLSRVARRGRGLAAALPLALCLAGLLPGCYANCLAMHVFSRGSEAGRRGSRAVDAVRCRACGSDGASAAVAGAAKRMGACLAALRDAMQYKPFPPPMPCELLSCLRDLRGRHRRGSVESVRPRPDRAVDRVSTAPRCVRVGLSIAGWRAGLHGKGWLARAPSPSAAVGLSLRPSAGSVGGPPPRPPPGSRHGSRAVAGPPLVSPLRSNPNLKDQTSDLKHQTQSIRHHRRSTLTAQPAGRLRYEMAMSIHVVSIATRSWAVNLSGTTTKTSVETKVARILKPPTK